METTIDAGGRVVIPKALRDRLGLGAGSRVEIHERDGIVTVTPHRPATRLENRDGVLVAVTDGPPAELDDDATRATLEAVRERRV